jgi:hypothetical protein
MNDVMNKCEQCGHIWIGLRSCTCHACRGVTAAVDMGTRDRTVVVWGRQMGKTTLIQLMREYNAR